MKYRHVMFLGAVAVMLVAGVSGKCLIKDPASCDARYPQKVVSSLSFNGTCLSNGEAVLVDGENYALDINFEPKQDVQKATLVARVKYGPLIIPFSVGNSDACKDMGLQCPLKADSKNTFHSEFSVNPTIHFPNPVHFALMLNLKNSGSGDLQDDPLDPTKSVFCIKVQAQLKPKSAQTEDTYEEPTFRVVH